MPKAKLKPTDSEHQGDRAAKSRVEEKSPDILLKRKCTKANISENHALSHGIVEPSDDCSGEGCLEEDQTSVGDHKLESAKDQQVRYTVISRLAIFKLFYFQVAEALLPASDSKESDNDGINDNVTSADPIKYYPVPSGSIQRVTKSEELCLSTETSNEDVNLEEELCEDTFVNDSCMISTNGKGGRGSHSKPKNKKNKKRNRKSMQKTTKDKMNTSSSGGRRTTGYSKITSKLFSYQHKKRHSNTDTAEADRESDSDTDRDTDEDMTTDGEENEDDSYKVVEDIRSMKRKGNIYSTFTLSMSINSTK